MKNCLIDSYDWENARGDRKSTKNRSISNNKGENRWMLSVTTEGSSDRVWSTTTTSAIIVEEFVALGQVYSAIKELVDSAAKRHSDTGQLVNADDIMTILIYSSSYWRYNNNAPLAMTF